MNKTDDLPQDARAARTKIEELRARMPAIGPEIMDLLFREARSFNAWQERPVPEDVLRQVHDLAKWGPTSANCCPLRIIFVSSVEAKAKLLECLAPGNVEKTKAAPVTAILGHDLHFFDHMDRLFPHKDMKPMFSGNAAAAEATAFRNGTLQAAYFMIAARVAGLDVGAMSGFNAPKVDAAFFAGTSIKSNFLCNLGYGSTDNLFARLPRFDFDDICTIL